MAAKRFGGRLGLTAVAVTLGLGLMAAPGLAQFRFGPGGGNNGSFDSFFSPYGPRYAPVERPADYSRAPAARKYDTQPPGGNVLVMGDSMADWLAYGLEDALGDTPDLAVVRKNRAYGGLIRYDSRNETLDWAGVAREAITSTKPKYIVMMLGINDRVPIRERAAIQPAAAPGQQSAKTSAPSQAAKGNPAPPDAADAERDNDDRPAVVAPEPPKSGKEASHTYEFRSDEWALAYMKRIDATIAALKSGGVPVFWVGLPALRGPKSTSDMQYLNELYRSRVEKAGITFIDVWDGFVDENGRFNVQGPDFEGQTRRLRTSDGVHFTKAGARKLAHYLEREFQRVATHGPVPVDLPQSEPQVSAPAGKQPTGPIARPMSGPVVPLTASVQGGQDLIAGGDAANASAPRSVTRVLVNGEAPPPPAGRADDFQWPRRAIAPVGADPVVATTTEPIPMMKPAPETKVAAPSGESRPVASTPKRATTTTTTTAARAPAPPPSRGWGSPGFSFFPFMR
jgi:hypothetical protein